MTHVSHAGQALPTPFNHPLRRLLRSLWITTCFGLSVASAETIIDNAATETDGSWTTSTSVNNYYGSNYTFNVEGNGSDKMRWRPNIAAAGLYLVSVWLPDGYPNRATDAPITVYYDGGSHTTDINQQNGGGSWVDLGVFNFASGTSGYVELTDNADGIVIGDAVRFQPVNSEVIVDNGATETDGTWTTSTSQPNKYGYNYAWNDSSGTGADKMRWRPILASGKYLVSVYLPNGEASRATNAPYTVYDANGSTTYEVNQQGIGGYWITLGEHTFNSGSSGYVELTDDADNSYVIGDAVRFKPVRESVIIENSVAERVGTWGDSTHKPDYSGANYSYTNSGSGADKMRWRPYLDGGYYTVSVWLPDGDSSRADNAPFTVYHGEGSTTYEVDQTGAGGAWVPLGSHYFPGGTSGYVELTDAGNSTYVIGDAVRFEPAPFIYYVDPVNGDMNNSGIASAPWSTLEDVFSNGTRFENGDTVYLLDGHHGYPTINRANEETVTIVAYPGHNPTAEKVRFNGATNYILDGLEISPELVGSTSAGILLNITGSSDITVSNCLLYSASDVSSWTANDWNTKASKGIEVEGPYCHIDNNTILNTSFAIVAAGTAPYTRVTRNTIDGFSGDGLRCLGDYQEFEYNLVQNAKKTNANHDDGFQSWSGANGNDNTVNGVVVRGNVFISYTSTGDPLNSAMQGIGCFDGFFEDWIVENNIVMTDTYHGLSFYGAINCRIVNNTIVENPLALFSPKPWISVYDHKNGSPSYGNIVRNNLSQAITGLTHSHATVDSNLTTSAYTDHFVDYANFDLHLKSTSTAIDAGSSTLAPAYDFEGDARDSSPDIGADEY